MRTKKKVSLTIDEEIYEAVEKASQVHSIPRSQIAEDALRLWLAKQTEALMAKGYEEMAEKMRKWAIAFEAQREILK